MSLAVQRRGKNIDFGAESYGSGFCRKGTRCSQELNFFQAHRWLHGNGRSGRDDLVVGFHSLPSSTLAANAAFYSAGLGLTIFAPHQRQFTVTKKNVKKQDPESPLLPMVNVV